MEFKVPEERELNKFSKEVIISLYLQLASSFQLVSDQNKTIMQQNEEQIKQIKSLQESLSILTNYRFGRKTEKTVEIFNGQYSFDPSGKSADLFLNEAELLLDKHPEEEEKTDEELLLEAKKRQEKRKRKKGVRLDDLKGAKMTTEDYTIPDDQLKEMFPEGYVEISARISHRVELVPAELRVYEERIHVYKSKTSNKFVEADHPKHLMAHSYLTPSLASKIITDKYVKALPINRISKEMGWMDVVMRPQTMSRWLEKLTEQYLTPIIEEMKRKIKEADLIHCDETPFVCVEDNKKPDRTKNSKSYMWVYHTADRYGSPPIFIYDYKDNRRTENVEDFMKNYHGILMADGYEPYHTVARKSNGDIVVGGCWAHCKRRFAEVIKTDPKNSVGTTAYEGNKRIAKIYHIDNKSKDMEPEKRKQYRQEKVKPLVDEFFEWAKEHVDKVATEATNKALHYAINQEIYLRAFLDNGIIPLDNSDAERSIRSFCVGKHNWHIASASKGADVSGKLYSIAETAKANGLKPYEYFKYLLEQLLENEGNVTNEVINDLMPWSDKLPEEVRATIK